jgi:hypothetical protein
MRSTSLQEKQFDPTFWNLFNNKDQGRRWQLDYLQPLQVLVIHAEVCKSYFNPNRGTFCKMDKFNDAIKTLLQTWTTPLVSSRFVCASLFIFRVGSFYFDLFPFVHNKNRVNWSNSSMATFVKSQHTCISFSISKLFSYCQMWQNLVPCQLWL